MSQLQGYFGQFRVTASMVSMTTHNATSNGSATTSLNSGVDVFICGYEGEATEHLCEWLENSIKGQTNHTNAVCNYSRSTGKVSLHFSESVNVYWDQVALGNALGFSNQWVNSAQVHTGDKQARYTWRPTRGLAEFPTHINTWWGQRSTSKVTRSVDGTVRSIQGNLLRDGTYSYRNLPRADVITDPSNSADQFRPLEQFWADSIHGGAVIRVYPDRTNMNSSGYHDGVIVAEESTGEPMDVGSFGDAVARSQPPWDVLWDVDVSMVKNV